MPTRQLPAHPDLEQLKRQAKELLRSARARDRAAVARFRMLPAFAQATDEDLSRASLGLHDAQSVIAREHGFPSWNALRSHVEDLTMTLDSAVVEFIEAATDGRTERAERLLGRYPQIARANLYTALVLGDVASAESYLANDHVLAHRPGGPRNWEPLLYLCHTSLARSSTAHRDGFVAIAGRLIELGADPNTRFPWLHHEVQRAVLWGATCVTRSLPLAQELLAAGADPNDGVTFPLAVGGADLAALDLLVEHGADVNQPWATDGAATLYAILQWADTSVGVKWLIEHGADPDPVFERNGETPLHTVARRWDPELAEMLVGRGADITRRRADGRTPFAVAQLNGNLAVADWLLGNGAPEELSDIDRFVAALSRNDRPTADTMIGARPQLRDEIGAEHYGALYQAAERGDTNVLDALLSYGFDPNRGDDDMGKTALHAAAMAGWPDAVRVLLEHGASVSSRDREFHAQPLVWAAEGSMSTAGDDRDHRACAQLLLDAGSPVEWQMESPEPSERILEVLAEWRRR